MKSPSPYQNESRRVRFSRLICTLSLASSLLSGVAIQAAVPADPSVEIKFSEGTGTTTTNLGTLGGTAAFDLGLNPEDGYPAFTNAVPTGTFVPAGNTFSLDMGPVVGNSVLGTGGRAVDLTTDIGTVGAFPKLTICGWLNARTLQAGSGGNRITFALESPGGLGFDLMQRGQGQLSLIINEYNDGSPTSSPAMITADPALGANNWVFFAVTYDPTLGSDQVKYYFGKANKLAALDVAQTYVGAAGGNIDFTGQLSLGNFGLVEGARAAQGQTSSRIFRGLMDEIKIYTNAFTLDEVQQAQLNSVVPPTPVTILQQPAALVVAAGQNAVFTVNASGSGQLTYQWRTNGVNVTGATSSTFTIVNATMVDNGKQVSVVVDNAATTDPGVVSANALLSVIPNDPHIVSFSFSEAGGLTTLNAGSFLGGTFFQQGSFTPKFPTFSSNVPSGPFAPNPIYNRSSLNMGDVLVANDLTTPGGQGNRAVDLTNNLVSTIGALGNMNGVSICGWINSGSQNFRTTGSFNNQVACASASDNRGFVLSHKADGSLQLNVNAIPSANLLNRSSASKIPVDTNHPAANWVFFAATYDGTLATGNLKFYFGDPNAAATLDTTLDYPQGVITATGPLTIGNFNLVTTASGRNINGANAAFCRGLLDEVKVFNKVLTLAEVQAQQLAPTQPALLLAVPQGGNIVLSWSATIPFQLQSRANVATGLWNNVLATENVVGNVYSVTVPKGAGNEFFRIVPE